MAWGLLPVNYTNAVWSGLKRYSLINNEDGTVSMQDVTVYSNKENSFFGAKDANRMNEALNTIMSMVENGTNLYEAFQLYFSQQKDGFEKRANTTQSDLTKYADSLKAEGDSIISGIRSDYSEDMAVFESQQQAIFTAWFKAIQDNLSKDAAGNLQNQCNELDERLALLELMATHNEFTAPLATDDKTVTLLVDELGFALLADWQYKEE